MYTVDYTDPFFPQPRETQDGYLTYWQAAEIAVSALRAHIETAAHAIATIMEGPQS